MAGKSDSSLTRELLTAALYKSNQGRMVRQFTFFAVVLIAAFGCITLANGPLIRAARVVQVAVPLVIWLVSGWIAFRAVNFPRFADFLISVESELARVTWPPRSEVTQATVVVLVTMASLGIFLFLIDIIWTWTFSKIGFTEMFN
ncbi:MAG: Preprotein translocase subunit SecE [Planctomycetota bacterium]|jgi:preprotein translocase subunit SecE